MARSDVYCRKVNQNTIIFAVVALIFLCIGCLRAISLQGVDKLGESCDMIDVAEPGWTMSECRNYYGALATEERRITGGEMLFCFSVCVLVLAGGVIYRNHASIKD